MGADGDDAVRVYGKPCQDCKEPWLYVRLTRREAQIFLDELAPDKGKMAPEIRRRLLLELQPPALLMTPPTTDSVDRAPA